MTEPENQQPATPPADKPEPSRREALRVGLTCGLVGAGAVGYGLLYDPKGDRGLPRHEARKLPNYFADLYDKAKSQSMPRLSIARGGQDAAKMVTAAMEPLGGMKTFVQSGDVVLVKPNVGFASSPAIGATTSPELVEAVVAACKQAGASRVIVADNPIATPATAFQKSKIAQAAERGGAEVMLPAEPYFHNVEIRPDKPDPRKGQSLGEWPIFWRPIAEATKVIGLPTVKDHNLCSASICMKNWYGLLGGRRDQFHQAIDNIVSDLGLMISPTLVIADGRRVLMRSGPTGGRKSDLKPANTVVAAIDQVACDAWCYENLMERDPARLKYLELAQAKFGEDESLKRFGNRDWRSYKSQGLVKEATLS